MTLSKRQHRLFKPNNKQPKLNKLFSNVRLKQKQPYQKQMLFILVLKLRTLWMITLSNLLCLSINISKSGLIYKLKQLKKVQNYHNILGMIKSLC